MRLLMHLFAIVGLLGMMTNVASKVLQSHPAPQYALQSAPHQQ
jgi:hypothetical protein